MSEAHGEVVQQRLRQGGNCLRHEDRNQTREEKKKGKESEPSPSCSRKDGDREMDRECKLL